MPRPTIASLHASLAESDIEVASLRAALGEEHSTIETLRRTLEISKEATDTHHDARQSTKCAIAQHLAVEHDLDICTVEDADEGIESNHDIRFLVWLSKRT